MNPCDKIFSLSMFYAYSKTCLIQHLSTLFHCVIQCSFHSPLIGGSRGGLWGLQSPPPLQISKIKESNKTKQNIEDNPLEKEKERKSCMFV